MIKSPQKELSDRKQLKTPDLFIQYGKQVLSFLLSHRTKLFGVLGMIILVPALMMSYNTYQNSRQNKAWEAYYLATKNIQEHQKVDALKSVSKDYAKTRPGFLAALFLADQSLDKAQKKILISPKTSDGISDIKKNPPH